MRKGENFYGEPGIEINEEPKRKIDGKRIDKKQIKKGGKGNYTVDLELAEQKFEADKHAERIERNKKKLNEKKVKGYTGGRGLQGADAEKIKITGEKTVENVDVDSEKTIEDLKREENDLVRQIQELSEGGCDDDSLWNEKKEIIAKLEANREKQEELFKGLRKTQKSNADFDEQIKDEPIAKEKIKQTHFGDEYFAALEQKQQNEKEEIKRKEDNESVKTEEAGFSREKLQELIEESVKFANNEELRKKIEAENTIVSQAEQIERMNKENKKDEEKFLELVGKLAEMEARLKEEMEKKESPEVKEGIKAFLKKNKKNILILSGLIGASAVTGGLAGAGYALSAAGLGEIVRRKIARDEKKNEILEEILNENNTEKSTDKNIEEIDIAKIVEFVQEAKKRNMTAQELFNEFNGDIELINRTIEVIKSKMSILAFTKEKRDINAAHKWLREKLAEINEMKKQERVSQENQENDKQQPPETAVEPDENKKEAKDLISDFNKKIADSVEEFKKGNIDGKKAYEFAADISDRLRSPAAKADPDVLNGYIEARRNIDDKIKDEITVAMVDFAMSENMDHEEILNLAKNLTLKNEERLREFIGEKAMKWLMTGEKEEEKGKDNYNEEISEALKKELEGIDGFMEKIAQDKVDGKEVFVFAEYLNNLFESHSQEEMSIIADKIQSYGNKTMAKAINLMVEYARDQQMKSEDVYKYTHAFGFSTEGVKIVNYEWLTGEKANLVIDGQEIKEGMAVYTVNDEELKNIKLFTREMGEGRWDTALAAIIEIAKENFPSIPSFGEIDSYDRTVENDGKRNILKIEMHTKTKIIYITVGIDEERKNIAVSDVIEIKKDKAEDNDDKPPDSSEGLTVGTAAIVEKTQKNNKKKPPETAVESEKKENEQEYAEWLIFKFKEKIADGIEKFNTGKLDGEGVFKFTEEVREMLNSPAADKYKGARSGYVDALRNIDAEIQARMVNSMVDFAMSKNMDNNEIRDLARILTWKNKEEFKNFKGVDKKNMEWLTTGEKEGEKKEFISKIEKTRYPLAEASEKNLEDFIKNSSELQAIIKTLKNPKVSISDLGKMIKSWNDKYPGRLTGLYVQKEFIGKEKAIKITMDDKGNVWVAGGDPDGLKYLKY